MTKFVRPVTFCVLVAVGLAVFPSTLFGQQDSSAETPKAPALQGATSASSNPRAQSDGPSGKPAASPAVEQSLAELAGKAVRIVTKGGGAFQGTLLSVETDRVEVRNSEGLIQQIWKADITEAINLESAGSRITYFQDAAQSRLLMMPTGFPLPKHEFQVTDQEIAVVTASYGVTDFFSLWGGISIPGAIVNARFSLPVGENIGISAGGMIGFSWLIDFPSGIGLPYVIASFGSPNQNFTAGISVPIIGSASTPISANGGIVALAGKVVVTPTASIVTENWIYVPWDVTSSMGFILPAVAFRIAGSRFSWDIGAVVPLEYGPSPIDGHFLFDGLFEGQVIPVPLLSITYRI